jgi:predicted Zn-ribbon and HTH transcriptional regulator
VAVFEKLVWAFRCERCGYEWIPRKLWSEGEELPTVCTACKSPYWNKPRKEREK